MAFNSTIQRKHCKCKPDCDKWPTLSCGRYWFGHMPEHIAKKAGTRRKVAIKNRNRRIAIAHKVKILQKEVDGGNDQEIWYLLRRYQMKGFCSEPGCNKSTNPKSDEYYRWSVCHLVPKSLCPSVATHPDNWIELCWQHHSEFDATFDKAAAMKCFEEAKRKFNLFKDLIPPEEARKINPHLLLPYIPDN